MARTRKPTDAEVRAIAKTIPVRTLTLRLNIEQAEALDVLMRALRIGTATKAIAWAVAHVPAMLERERALEGRVAELTRTLADLALARDTLVSAEADWRAALDELVEGGSGGRLQL